MRHFARHPFRLVAVGLTAAATVAVSAACAPPAQPPWVGVQWIRDTGGTVDPMTGYTPALGRFLTTGGVTTGPTPVSPADLASLFLSSDPLLPDGTARFPWNGFAGEGITTTEYRPGPYVEWTLHYPAGSCLIGFADADSRLSSVTPSPDGHLAAVVSSVEFGGAGWTTIGIVSLDVTGCPSVVSANYDFRSGYGPPSGYLVGGRVVWSPNSAAVTFPLTAAGTRTPGTGTSIARLNASAGSTPTPVLAASAGCITPSGWSAENRLILTCLGPAPYQTRIITIPMSGSGTTNTIDSFVGTADTVGPYFHSGYYVPGTNTIVLEKVVPVVNSDGLRQAWSQVHTAYDLPFAPSTPITGSTPPLLWHPVVKNGQTVPPYEYTEAPNWEFIDRLAH